MRLNIFSYEICNSKSLNNEDSYELTENFDGFVNICGNYVYINLKFVCDKGGAQTRSLREVYHMIYSQLNFLLQNDNVFFINILDGDESYRNIDKFLYCINKKEYNHIKHRIYCGDLYNFIRIWKKMNLNNIVFNNINMNKQKLGQFYTTNYEYILTDMKIPENVETIIEPFVGNGDLLKFLEKEYKLECYDIEPMNTSIDIEKRNTLLNPPSYRDKFILTNPPYLSRNKSDDKTLFDKYKVNDLYKCFIKELFINKPQGGIIIIPLNFLCSIRKMDIELRKCFFKTFNISRINVFDEKVFDDTSYSVCSIQFSIKTENDKNNLIEVKFFPSKLLSTYSFNKDNNYTIGGEIYNLKKNNNYKITRLIQGMKQNTNILVKCIDDNIDKKICLRIVDDDEIYIDDTKNKSARTYATLVIEPEISMKKQEILVDKFNKYLNEMRDKNNSLFLSTYRESKNGFNRKRISFELVYSIVSHLLN